MLVAPIASANAEDRIGPSFDCDKATRPLARMICASPELSKIDLSFNQAYQALRQQVAPAEQDELNEEDVEFIDSVLRFCGVPEQSPVAGSPDCVGAQYNRQRSLWVSRLNGTARDEAERPIEQHLALQRDLQKLGYLPAAGKIDGVYGPATRRAIAAWQTAAGRPASGFIGGADAISLARAASDQPAHAAPSPSPLVAQPGPSTTVSPPSPIAAPPAQISTPAEIPKEGGVAGWVYGIIGLVLLVAVVSALVKAAERRRRVQLACAYINDANQRRYFPAVPVGINMQTGEVGLLQAPAQLSEMRSHRYSTGGSVRVAKGVWVSSRRYHSYRTRDVVDHGTVAITTRRIAYTGAAKTAQVMFRDLVAIEGDVDTNVVHTARRQNAVVIHYREAMLGLILVRFFASAGLADNRLPDGWQFTARPEGSSIAIDLSGGAQPAIAGR